MRGNRMSEASLWSKSEDGLGLGTHLGRLASAGMANDGHLGQVQPPASALAASRGRFHRLASDHVFLDPRYGTP